MNRVWLLLVAITAPLAGQAPADSARLAAIRTFRRGTALRLVYTGTGSVEGEFVRGVGDSLILVRGRVWETMPAAGIDSVWVRGNRAGTGALVGSVAGAVLLGWGAASLNRALCEGPDCNEGGAFVRGALIGGLGGMLFGAGIGAAVPRWRLRYPPAEP